MDKNKNAREYLGSQDKDLLNILRSSGKSRPANDFPILQIYLEETGSHPMVRDFNEISINHISMVEELERWNIDKIFVKETVEEKTFTVQPEQLYFKLQAGYYLEVSVGYTSADEFDDDLAELLNGLNSSRQNMVMVSTVTLFCPSNKSPLYSSSIEDKVLALIKNHKVAKSVTNPSIAMICQDDGQYYLKDFYIKKDYTISEGDMHYGVGFNVFHEALLERFKLDPKGLVLFHGLPGTGKTFYIRSLIKDLLKLNKYIIYLPPNMVESLVHPDMMTFISSTVMEQSEDGRSCILLLEDAEPLLASRKHENRSSGITNLLNITDGILNDMLSIQVIATFNTDLANIDDALLRPERLIARKEFKKLKKEDAQLLADKLKINKKIEADSSLAEIYSQSKHSEILVHEYNQESRPGKIGF